MSRFWPGLAMAAALAAPAWAAERPQTTPMAEPHLFISPCGQPFRSEPGQPYPVVAWFTHADTNHDGKLDRAEFRADAEAFFHILDRDKNGIVEDAEVSYYEKNLVPEITAGQQLSLYARQPLILAQDSSSKKSKEGDIPYQGAGSYGLLNDAEPVRSADRHLEGRIKLDDFLARADYNFDALVPDGKDYLTLEELPRTAVQEAGRPARKKA